MKDKLFQVVLAGIALLPEPLDIDLSHDAIAKLEGKQGTPLDGPADVLTNPQIKQLCEALKGRNVKSLDLSQNLVDDVSGMHIAKFVENNNTLEALILFGNRLGDDNDKSALAIIEALKNNKSSNLKFLNVGNCSLGYAATIALRSLKSVYPDLSITSAGGHPVELYDDADSKIKKDTSNRKVFGKYFKAETPYAETLKANEKSSVAQLALRYIGLIPDEVIKKTIVAGGNRVIHGIEEVFLDVALEIMQKKASLSKGVSVTTSATSSAMGSATSASTTSVESSDLASSSTPGPTMNFLYTSNSSGAPLASSSSASLASSVSGNQDKTDKSVKSIKNK